MVTTELLETAFGPMEAFVGDHVTKHLKRYGAYQRSDLAMLLSIVQPGDTVLDVGAHIGTFAIPFGKAVGSTGHVFAFEAMPETLALLERNVVANDLSGRVCCVHATVGSGAPYVLGNQPLDNSGAARFKGTTTGAPTLVLDEWWNEHGSPLVQLAKIDVEGMEQEVLRGARNLISRCRPAVQFEVNIAFQPAIKELQWFFAAQGYRFLLNTASRHSATDRFSPGRMSRIDLPRLGLQTGWDVLAVHPSSGRLPHSVSPWLTTLRMLRLGARSTMGAVLPS